LAEAGDAETALAWIDEGLELAEKAGSRLLVARALQARIIALSTLGRDEESQRCAEDELRVRHELGDAVGEAASLANLADADLRAGALASARERLQRATELLVSCDHALIETLVFLNRGMVGIAEGDRVASRSAFLNALDIAWRAASQSDVDCALLGLALACDDPVRASTLYGYVDASLAARGEKLQALETTARDADHARRREVLGDEAFNGACAVGAAMSRADAIALARDIAESRG
jgi:tetratricopeptide (TPR) repeat protein